MSEDTTGEPFIVEYSTHTNAGEGVHGDVTQDTPVTGAYGQCGDDGVLDARHDNDQIDGGNVDHDPEPHEEDAPSPATPTPATPGSPRTPAASAAADASPESEPLRLRNISSIYRDTVPIDLEYSGLCLLGIEEPANFNEANGIPSWRRAMEEELSSIENNKTWSLTTLSAGHKAIGLK